MVFFKFIFKTRKLYFIRKINILYFDSAKSIFLKEYWLNFLKNMKKVKLVLGRIWNFFLPKLFSFPLKRVGFTVGKLRDKDYWKMLLTKTSFWVWLSLKHFFCLSLKRGSLVIKPTKKYSLIWSCSGFNI